MNRTRRRALQAGLTAVGALLAGCTAEQSAESTLTRTATEADASTATTGATAGTTADVVETTRTRTATLRTTEGDVTVELFAELVPTTVANFVGLATGAKEWEDPETGETRTDPLYEDVAFHRIIEGFVIQGGDPMETGRGGPGYSFDDEFHPDLRHDSAGVLSMANRGPDTNGSQFFITLDATPHLDGRHTVFGVVVDGMSVVEEIGAVPTDANDRPVAPVVLESVDVAEN